jgi:hypothetical protein
MWAHIKNLYIFQLLILFIKKGYQTKKAIKMMVLMQMLRRLRLPILMKRVMKVMKRMMKVMTQIKMMMIKVMKRMKEMMTQIKMKMMYTK